LSRIPALRPLPIRLLAAVLVYGAVLAGLMALPSAAKAAQYDTSSAGAVIAAMNSARVRAGLRPLTVNSELTTVARGWTSRMAASGTLSHNPNLAGSVHDWTLLGENVGEGSSASQVEAAFMASAPHRANILRAQFTDVGVGAVRGSDGRLWVTVDFKRRASAVASTPAPPVVKAPNTSLRSSAANRSSRSSVRTAVPKVGAAKPSVATAMPPTMRVLVPVRFPGAATARLANSAFNSTHHLRPATGR
jgi:hypothetical protein